MFDHAIKVTKRGGFQKVLREMADYDWESFFTIPKSGLIVHSLT